MVNARHTPRLVVEPQGTLYVNPFQGYTDQARKLQILPWDSDLDVQMSEKSIHFLASYYNMTVFHFKTPRLLKGRDYLLEINPNYVNRDESDTGNVIDARWIDMTTGLFIDITAVRYDKNHHAGENVLTCKDGHQYGVCYSKQQADRKVNGHDRINISFHCGILTSKEYQQRSHLHTKLY